MRKIVITEDSNCEMLQILSSDGKCLFEGNYWDFERSGVSFKKMFELLNFNVELIEKDYDDWYE